MLRVQRRVPLGNVPPLLRPVNSYRGRRMVGWARLLFRPHSLCLKRDNRTAVQRGWGRAVVTNEGLSPRHNLPHASFIQTCISTQTHEPVWCIVACPGINDVSYETDRSKYSEGCLFVWTKTQNATLWFKIHQDLCINASFITVNNNILQKIQLFTIIYLTYRFVKVQFSLPLFSNVTRGLIPNFLFTVSRNDLNHYPNGSNIGWLCFRNFI